MRGKAVKARRREQIAQRELVTERLSREGPLPGVNVDWLARDITKAWLYLEGHRASASARARIEKEAVVVERRDRKRERRNKKARRADRVVEAGTTYLSPSDLDGLARVLLTSPPSPNVAEVSYPDDTSASSLARTTTELTWTGVPEGMVVVPTPRTAPDEAA